MEMFRNFCLEIYKYSSFNICMFFEIFIAIILGIGCGIITGLTPGIHVNLIALILSTQVLFLSPYLSLLQICVIIFACALTHSFIDSIPSIYFGAPDSDQALSVLPGHKLLLEGKGHQAIVFTLIGSYFAYIGGLLLFPFFIYLMKILYPVIKDVTGYLLILVMCYMILKEKGFEKKFLSFFFFVLAGVLGILVLNNNSLENPLFHLLSGLFGLSILIISLSQTSILPEQIDSKEIDIERGVLIKSVLVSIFVGFIAAFLPGFSSSQAAIVAKNIVGEIGKRGFLVLVGGINTANFLISLCSLYIIEKARNGAVLAINELTLNFNLNFLILLVIVSLICASTALILAIGLSKSCRYFIKKVNYKKIVLSIIYFLVLLSFFMDGLIGLVVLITSTSVGILASLKGVGKNHLMGCLILPVIFYFTL
jgi:putative membrane protein